MGWASLIMIIVLMIHAYGSILAKMIDRNSIEINLYQGLVIFVSCSCLAPLIEAGNRQRVEMSVFLKGLVYYGITTAVGQLFYIEALKLSKNTGMLTTLSFSSVILNNMVSLFLYN